MAAANAIKFIRRDGAGAAVIEHLPEESSQTFLNGVPVYAQAADGQIAEVTSNFGNTEIVRGVSIGEGQNLATQGTAEPGASVATPPNQASAVTIPIGTPFKTGKTAMYNPDGGAIFEVALIDGQTYSAGLVLPGTQYELEKQGNGYWAVDSTDTSTSEATDHVVEIVGVNPNDNEFVYVRFTAGRRFGN